MKNTLIALVVLSFLYSCQNTPQKIEASTTEKRSFDGLFGQILEAHGGVESWEAAKYLEYEITTGAGTEKHRIDLKSRKSRIDKEEKFSLGFDGVEVWVSPNRDSFPGSSPRFMHNLHFYFFAIPFVLTDPGVNYEDMGTVIANDKEYKKLKATFDDGVGDAPDDHYILFVDPSTNQVDFINYSVTFYDKERATSYNALDYTFQNINGLVLPASYTGYKWEDGKFGEKRYQASFGNIQLVNEVPDTAIFDRPAGAWKESDKAPQIEK